jgi:hypothetical protein
VEPVKPKAAPPVHAGPGETAKSPVRGRKRPAGFAGLPIGVWIAIGAGLILAGVLGVAVFLKNAS